MSRPIDQWNESDLRQRAADLATGIDSRLAELIRDEKAVPNLHDAMAYSLGLDVEERAARGKRIRPALCQLAGLALGVGEERTRDFAAAIELLHNFALVHDDIEDGDEMRRGRPATWVRFATPHGINAGDYLFAKVFSTISRDPHNPPPIRAALLEVVHQTMEQLFAGQAMDINARHSTTFSMAQYEELVAAKTGSYLAAPMLGAAVIAEAPPAVLDALRAYGVALGPLFQIKDDLIDLTSGKGREKPGNDLREGKRSYLVAATLETAAADDRARLLGILDKPRDANTDEEISWAVELFRRTGALERAETRCAELEAQGLRALEAMPPALAHLLHLVTRMLAARET